MGGRRDIKLTAIIILNEIKLKKYIDMLKRFFYT